MWKAADLPCFPCLYFNNIITEIKVYNNIGVCNDWIKWDASRLLWSIVDEPCKLWRLLATIMKLILCTAYCLLVGTTYCLCRPRGHWTTRTSSLLNLWKVVTHTTSDECVYIVIILLSNCLFKTLTFCVFSDQL